MARAGERGSGRIALLAFVLEKRIPMLKTDEERYVLGIVLEPETVDAQDDIYSAAEIREAAHRFMEEYRNIGLMHRGLVNGRVKILESYLAPTSFALEGAQVRKGTWLLAMRVLDDDLWSQVKSGELSGLSMGGSAPVVPSLPQGTQAPAHDLHREREAEVAGGGRLGDRVTADPGDPTCRHGTRGGNES